MDQEQKTSNLDLLIGNEADDNAFDALWGGASKGAGESHAEGDDPLLASSIGHLLDWDDLSNDNALWNDLDARVSAKKQEVLASGTENPAVMISEELIAEPGKLGDVLSTPEETSETKSEEVPEPDEAQRNKILAMIGRQKPSEDEEAGTASKAKELAQSMLNFELDDEFVANYSRKGDAHSHDKTDTADEPSEAAKDSSKDDLVQSSIALANATDIFSDIETEIVSTGKESVDLDDDIAVDLVEMPETTEDAASEKTDDASGDDKDTAKAESDADNAEDETKEVKDSDLVAMLKGARADVLGDEKDEKEDDKDAEAAEKHAHHIHEGGAVLALEDAPESDEETDSGDDIAGMDSLPEIRLSERARMGKVYPDGDIITSDIEIGSDVIYPAESSHKLFWVAVVLLIALIGVIALMVSRGLNTPQITFAQKGAFQQTLGTYNHLYGTKDGLVAMCSDGNGAVEFRGKYSASFMPQSGCETVRISDDGKKLHFIDSENRLFEIALDAKDAGMNPVFLTELPNRIGSDFAVTPDGKVIYLKQLNMTTQVLSTLDIKTQKSKDTPLPQDAIVCNGMTSRQYAYISQNSIHLFVDGLESVSSLEAPKLGAVNQLVATCTANDDKAWGVMYKLKGHIVLRQGRGNSSEDPVDLEEDVAVRSGAKTYQLLRSSNGLDFVTQDKWVHVDTRNQKFEKKLSETLNTEFAVVLSSEDGQAFSGLNGGKLMSISSDGKISYDQAADTAALQAAAFVNDGYHVVALSQTENETILNLWNLHEGSFVISQTLDISAKAMNISASGQYGLLIDDAKAYLVSWASNTIKTIGTFKPSHNAEEIENIEWSENDQYFLIHYEDGTTELYQRNETGDNIVSLMRSYPEGVLLAFSHNGLMWHYDESGLMSERIGDGALSVIDDNMTRQLDKIDVLGIAMHPRSNDVVFWGDKGMILMNVGDNASQMVTSKAISWVTPDRKGNYIASSAGILELLNGELTPLPAEIASEQLEWVGFSTSLQNESGRLLYNVKTKEIAQLTPKSTEIRCIGANCGFHASGNYILSSRGNILTLQRFDIGDDNARRTIAAFSGTDANNWCWIAANGALQGSGNVCTLFESQNADNQSIGMNAEIAKLMGSEMPSTKINPFAPSFIDFKDDVSLTVETVPEGGFAFFLVGEGGGELPPSLVFPNGVEQTPLDVKLKRDSRELIVGVAVGGYKSRSVTFKPDRANLKLRIPVLPEEDSNLWPIWKQVKDGEEDPVDLQVDEDLDIEFKAILYANRDAIKDCMKGAGTTLLTLAFKDEHFETNDPEDPMKLCILPVLNDINDQHDSRGILPGIDDLGNVQIQIVQL